MADPDIALIWLSAKDGTAQEVVESTGLNVCSSRKEPENLRFDLLQSSADTYVLFEVYKSSAGAAAHKETSHFKEWAPKKDAWLKPDGRDRRQYRVHGGKGVTAFKGGDVSPENDTTIVHVSCKPGTEERFIEATKKNQAGVQTNEPDAIRFDILQQIEDPTKFVLFEVFKNAEAVAHHKTLQHFLDWRKDVEDCMAERRRGEKVTIVPLGEKNAVMKVTAKKSAGFYIKSARTFLQGSPDKPPVEELIISALGEAVNVAGAVATQIEKEGLAQIAKISTDYPEMGSGDKSYGCVQMQVVLKPTKA
jgi:autoinducer 2-degrading protein